MLSFWQMGNINIARILVSAYMIYRFTHMGEIFKYCLCIFLCILIQKAQRSYQKDKAKFEEAKESHELDAEGCKYTLFCISLDGVLVDFA